MSLVAYGAQDQYLSGRRFFPGWPVPTMSYIQYIAESIYTTVKLRIKTEKWIHNNIHVRWLLRRVFEMETGIKWKQFDNFVLHFCEETPKPTMDDICPPLEDFDFLTFYNQNFKYIYESDIKECIGNEPVKSDFISTDDLIAAILHCVKFNNKSILQNIDFKLQSVWL